MSKIGPLLIAIGAIVLLLSAFANVLGLGLNPDLPETEGRYVSTRMGQFL